MKIAIQGHPTRGKEVIQILKSLGGKDREELTGRRISHYYFINCNGDIDLNLRINLLNRKLYTLEEFEKKFPLKIGETVITTLNHVGTIIDITNGKYKVLFREDSALIALRRLKSYKEMERNVTLTLDKAKEWYKKGGELREIALQAFTEKELNALPRSWEEFCNNYPVKSEEIFIDKFSKFVVNSLGTRDPIRDKNICPSQKSAEAHLAMMQLEQLRDCWRQDWEPDWNDKKQTKYCVIYHEEKFKISILYESRHFLSFPTKEMAEEFLKYFRYLIEQAGDLI